MEDFGLRGYDVRRTIPFASQFRFNVNCRVSQSTKERDVSTAVPLSSPGNSMNEEKHHSG